MPIAPAATMTSPAATRAGPSEPVDPHGHGPAGIHLDAANDRPGSDLQVRPGAHVGPSGRPAAGSSEPGRPG